MKKVIKMFFVIVIIGVSGFWFIVYGNKYGGLTSFITQQLYYAKQKWRKESVSPVVRIKKDYISFVDWQRKCNNLPLTDHIKNQTNQTALTKKQFEEILDDFIILEKKQTEHDDLWVGKKRLVLHEEQKSKSGWWQIIISWFSATPSLPEQPFEPVAQKLIVPAGSIIAFHGDLHGDVHSVIEFIEHLKDKKYMDADDPFKIAKDNFYMIFLGDYVDRGWHGSEVMYTITRLKVENPNQVFLVRGNHEDKDLYRLYGFNDELHNKFDVGQSDSLVKKINQMQELLPVVLYIGCTDSDGVTNFLQCCHGGMELGYNPQWLFNFNRSIAYQTLGKLERKSNNNKLESTVKNAVSALAEKYNFDPHYKISIYDLNPEELQDFLPEKPVQLWHLWGDFIVESDEVVVASSGRGTGLACGKPFTDAVREQHSSNNYKVRGVFRAHQHGDPGSNPMMARIFNDDKKGAREDAGVGKLWIPKGTKKGGLWDGIVCTFAVTPKSGYGSAYKRIKEFGDAYGILTVAQDFDDWVLEVIRLKDNQK